jgi:hypothetical protein
MKRFRQIASTIAFVMAGAAVWALIVLKALGMIG